MSPLALLPRPLADYLAEPVRDQFPGLRRGSARFDGPGGTLVHAAVGEAIGSYLRSEHVANDHGAFPASGFSDEIVRWSTERIGELLGVSGSRMFFGPNMTTMTTMFVRSLGALSGPGDEIVTTELDHEANVTPWEAMARQSGATVRTARLSSTGELAAEAVIAQLSERTRWVAVTAASNALGAIPDLAAITAAAHAVGARVYVDGVQAVAHRAIDLAALGCDGFVTAPYKWYGPHCGVLVLRDEVAHDLRLVEQVPSAGSDLPGRLELGTRSFEAVLGSGVAADVLLGWDRDELFAREAKLTEILFDRLSGITGVRLLGPEPGPARAPVLTFQVAGHSAGDVAARLASAGVSVWDGTFYSSPAMRAVSPGEPDAVRAGIAAYTTESDVDALAEQVDRLTR